MDRRSRLLQLYLFLHNLGPVQGERIQRNDRLVARNERTADTKCRRDFLCGLAFLCDYDKGGPTVTALALQEGQEILTYWLASNENPETRIAEFLATMLSSLRTYVNEPHPDGYDKFLRMCIQFNVRRIKKYSSLLRRAVDRCFEHRSHSPAGLATIRSAEHEFIACREKADALRMLKDLQDILGHNDHYRICEYTSERVGTRLPSRLSPLTLPAQSGEFADDVDEYGEEAYKSVRHYIGRLAAYRRITGVVMDTAKKYPRLVSSTNLRLCPSPPSLNMSLRPVAHELEEFLDETLSIQDSAMRASLTQAGSHKASEALAMLHNVSHHETRVHAELVLLEAMWEQEIVFVGGDRFIGSSKPACYGCYQYMRLHPSGVELPGSHYKTYANWRPPDQSLVVHSEEPIVSTSARHDLLGPLQETFRIKIFERLQRLPQTCKWRYDSTSGIPTNRTSTSFESPSSGVTSLDADASRECALRPRLGLTQPRACQGLIVGLMSCASFTAAAILVCTTVSVLELHLPFPALVTALATLLSILQLVLIFMMINENKQIIGTSLMVSLCAASVLDIVIISEVESYRGNIVEVLESSWQLWFQDKHQERVHKIQDRFSCCGFRSAVDRAWPFPDKTHKADACISAYGRTQSCLVPCKSWLQTCLMLCLASAVMDLIIKIIVIAKTLLAITRLRGSELNADVIIARLSRIIFSPRSTVFTEEEPLLYTACEGNVEAIG